MLKPYAVLAKDSYILKIIYHLLLLVTAAKGNAVTVKFYLKIKVLGSNILGYILLL